MSSSDIFTLVLPSLEYFDKNPKAENVLLGDYLSLAEISQYSSASLLLTTIDDWSLLDFFSKNRHSGYISLFTIIMNNTVLTAKGRDEVYTSTIDNYYAGKPITIYSSASGIGLLTWLSGSSLSDFGIFYVG